MGRVCGNPIPLVGYIGLLYVGLLCCFRGQCSLDVVKNIDRCIGLLI